MTRLRQRVQGTSKAETLRTYRSTVSARAALLMEGIDGLYIKSKVTVANDSRGLIIDEPCGTRRFVWLEG